MKAKLLLPAIASLALLAAVPASAQTFARFGYDPQGGGGAGPYALSCRRFANFNQRQHCTQMVMQRHYRYRDRYRGGFPFFGPLFW